MDQGIQYQECSSEELLQRLEGLRNSSTLRINNINVSQPFGIDFSVFPDLFPGASLIFTNCKFNSFSISRNTKSYDNKLIYLKFDNCYINHAHINEHEFLNVLLFENSTIGHSEIYKNKFRELSFKGCTINSIHIGWNKIGIFKLEKVISQQIYIGELGDPNEFGTLSIENGDYNDIQIHGNDIQHLIIKGPIKCQEFLLTATKWGEPKPEQLYDSIKELVLINFNTNLQVRDFKINNITCNNCFVDKELLLFEGVKVKEFSINNLLNYGRFVIIKLMPLDNRSSFIIRNSSLGKAYIADTNFEPFADFKIVNSSIEDIRTNLVVWNTDLRSSSSKERTEFYRQLKVVSDKKSDKMQSLYYEKLEMDAYGQELSFIKRNEWKEKFIFWLSKYTNEFGLNWFRPLWLLFLSALLFFLAVEVTVYTNCYKPYPSDTLVSYIFFDRWGDFFYFLDPTHKLTDIHHNIRDCNSAKVLDYFSRISAAFFIVQIISAFRKYYRK